MAITEANTLGMKTPCFLRRSLLAGLAMMLPGSQLASAAPLLRFGSGATPGDLTSVVDAFRGDLGGVNNGVGGGPFTTGFRAINWDGVPNTFAAPNNLPGNFFNANSPRGLNMATPGTGFQVSAATGNPSGAPLRFGHIDPTYAGVFQPFSQERLFSPLGSTTTDINFFVPGSPTSPAFVRGFGVIFADVDRADSTELQFLDAQGQELFSAFAPARNGGLSFVGVTFDNPDQVFSVRIISGDTPLGSGILDGPAQDLVVMDDFFYGEPLAAVPEASTTALFAAGALALVAWRRARRLN